jgi:hypothetical protein
MKNEGMKMKRICASLLMLAAVSVSPGRCAMDAVSRPERIRRRFVHWIPDGVLAIEERLLENVRAVRPVFAGRRGIAALSHRQ